MSFPELFVGVTSWNSELFLPICLESLFGHSQAVNLRVVVLDNMSTDRSREIAVDMGAEVIARPCLQGDALNYLAGMSRSTFTLLIHADVVFLNPDWYGMIAEAASDRTALVSPQDIGCGPFTRPFGKGMPESSFMFFRTEALKRLRQWSFRWHGLIPALGRSVDFYGDHVTHNLPMQLASVGYDWKKLKVHVSKSFEKPLYQPEFKPSVWSDELPFLIYGLGNFYSIDGAFTHYHNWYDRLPKSATSTSKEETSKPGGFPTAYISAYTNAFIEDYRAGRIQFPDIDEQEREPRAL